MSTKSGKTNTSRKKTQSNSKKAPMLIALAAVGLLVVVIVAISVISNRVGVKENESPTKEAQTMITEAKPETNRVIENDGSADGPRNLLTGEPCTEAVANNRPVAIMINNIQAAWPQYNTSRADIIYECEVEGGSTRLMALYSNVAGVEDSIGSVRSSREYYIDFASNHDAIYVHAGGSESAYDNLYSRGTDHLDGVNGGAETHYYVRDSRRTYMAYEHQLCITGPNLMEAVAKKGLRTVTDTNSFANSLQFVPYGKSETPAGENATYVTTPFGAATANFEFDAATQKYLRYEYGRPQTDKLNGDVQLSFDNVIVLFCPYSYTGDAKGHIDVNTTGNGTGYYISRGKYIPITWKKDGMDIPVVLTKADGKALSVNTGKTFISIVSSSRIDQVTMNP